MCVIIVKPRGIQMPSESILRAAYNVNSDGCGFVSENDYFKTLNYSQFITRLRKCNTDENVIIHFRLATHGSVKVSNCHPFINKGLFFAHNGILDIKPTGDTTDSETALRKYIRPACDRHGFGTPLFNEICREIAGYSKFAMMQNGEICLTGNYADIDGVLYSNLRFYNHFLNNRRIV